MRLAISITAILLHTLLFVVTLTSCASAELPSIQIAPDGRAFLLESGQPFRVWGFNYDHDADGRLIEDYWQEEWPKVAADFTEMKSLGANVVRIHLQFGRFMRGPKEPNAAALAQLKQLLELAERTGLYLDLTGLGCYHKADVPPWYDKLSESDRWAAQAEFWAGVAKTCAASPAVFCYDLMNEPVVPGGGKRDDWLGPAFGGKYFVQFISLELAGRDRTDVSRQWITTLVSAIRAHDARHLITVGLVDWSLDRPGITSGFVPEKIADQLDFLAVHVYPESGKLGAAVETLRAFQLGKPLVVEETFPLKCSTKELEQAMDSVPEVAGWIGFYWGETSAECRSKRTIAGAITADWLDFFARRSAH
jgi:hypothetical protein